jgi:hypothetical protein
MIVRLFVNKWDTIPRLSHLSSNDPAFMDFVEDHVDILMSPKEADQIKYDAQRHCPAEANEICRRIIWKIDHFQEGER